MGIYEELQARGLIAQVTNEPEIREMVNTGKATFYIGFDPTADSLHVVNRAAGDVSESHIYHCGNGDVLYCICHNVLETGTAGGREPDGL